MTQGVRIVLLVGAPRSGTTLLEHILSSHSQIHGGAEPHLLTPLAHLGVFRTVDRAPYDHILAALGQRSFVKRLPREEADYFEACRAYCETLYARVLAGTGKTIFLDKTPEYATVLPFISQVLPSARYVVLSRHPAAIFTSFANSFFDRDFEVAYRHDPILERYIPALADFLRRNDRPFLHLRYEDLVASPEEWVRRIYEHIGVPHEAATIRYAQKKPEDWGLGDPITVRRCDRPVTASVEKWVDELVRCPEKVSTIQRQLERIDPADLELLGYPPETLWLPLRRRSLDPCLPSPRKARLTRYALERRAIVRGRALVQRSENLRRVVRTVRLACDVLLREY